MLSKQKSDIDGIYLDYVNMRQGREEAPGCCMKRITKVFRRVRRKRSFIHHDYAYHNILHALTEEHIVDFDYCIGDIRIHDIGFDNQRYEKSNWDIERP